MFTAVGVREAAGTIAKASPGVRQTNQRDLMEAEVIAHEATTRLLRSLEKVVRELSTTVATNERDAGDRTARLEAELASWKARTQKLEDDVTALMTVDKGGKRAVHFASGTPAGGTRFFGSRGPVLHDYASGDKGDDDDDRESVSIPHVI
jgi:hypothetical protein